MLRSFRKGADGFLAKILMIALIASFALWGIGDIFRSAPDDTVATVADEPITLRDLESSIQAQQRMFTELTPEVAQSPQVRLQFLQRLINSRLLLAEAKSLNIIFSEEALSREIAQDPSFHNENGEFDRELFLTLLRQNNLSQGAFLDRYARDMQISVLHSSIALSLQIPDAMVELYHNLLGETRQAALLLLDTSDIKAIEQPSQEELQNYYNDNEEQFRLPEYRRYRYALFDTDSVPDNAQPSISDEAIADYYTQHQDTYQLEQRYELFQLSFDSKEAALAAADALGNSPQPHAVLEYAKNAKGIINADNVKLGAFTKSQVPLEEELAKSLLDAGKNSLSEPLETPFGWQIIYYADTLESGVRPLKDVRTQIERKLKEEGRGELLNSLSDQIDDAIAGGATLKEALSDAGLEKVSIEEVGPISATNTLPDGKTQTLLPAEQEILQVAYAQSVGDISPISISHDQRYFVVETLDVIPQRIAALETVAADIRSQMTTQRKKEALAQQVQELAEDLQSSENPLAAAKERGLSLHSSGKLNRSEGQIKKPSQLAGTVLGPEFMRALFALRVNQVSSAIHLPDGSMAIAILESIHPAPPADEQTKTNIRESLRQQFSQEAVSAYLSALREKHGVEMMIDRIFAGSAAASGEAE